MLSFLTQMFMTVKSIFMKVMIADSNLVYVTCTVVVVVVVLILVDVVVVVIF